MRWADAHASIDLTNSMGIRVQMRVHLGRRPPRSLSFCLGLMAFFICVRICEPPHGVNWWCVMVMVLYVLLGIMGLAILTDVARLMTAQRLRARGARSARPGSGV
jgi:hypothetical protein